MCYLYDRMCVRIGVLYCNLPCETRTYVRTYVVITYVQGIVLERSLLPSLQPSAKMVQAAKNTVPHVTNQSASMQLANMSRLTTIAISNLKNAVDRVRGQLTVGRSCFQSL